MFIVFPGQGSQKFQMGLNVDPDFLNRATAKKYISQAQDITERDIEYLLCKMPQKDLDKTENAQLAIFVTTYVLALDFLENKQLTLLAGHSLGEYIALAVSGVLSFGDMCKLIAARSEIMSKISGSMLAVLGVSFEEANTIANFACNVYENDCCFVANHNSSTQFVLSGTKTAIERAKVVALKMFGKKAIMLATSGPFHSPYMAFCCEQLAPVLDGLIFNTPSVPVISNIFASSENIDWKQEIFNHMQMSVRWHSSIEYAKQYMKEHDITQAVEIGVVPVLGNMAKRDGFEIQYFNEV